VKSETALLLMKRALAIYDRDGEGATCAACHLQAAIDAAASARPVQPHEEIDPALLAEFDAHIERSRRGPLH